MRPHHSRVRAIYMKQPRGIQLNQSEYRWDRTESPASFVLRYTCAIRRFLLSGLNSEDATDQILETLIQSLVSNGYEGKRAAKIRDYLIAKIKDHVDQFFTQSNCSAAPEEVTKWITEALNPQSLIWMRAWRDSLLERSWRSLERAEHIEPEIPAYSVLHASSTQPNATLAMIRVQMATAIDLKIPEERIGEILAVAKVQFAQILADEICETLSGDSLESIQEEIQLLGLNRAFDGIKLDV